MTLNIQYMHMHVVYIYIFFIVLSQVLILHFPSNMIIIMMKAKPLILVFFSMFIVLHCLTNQANSDSPLEHTAITTTQPPVRDSCVNSCAQPPPLPPPPRKTYCSRSFSSPPPPKYMYMTGVPGELYRTESDDQWGYYSSANQNSVKCLLVIVIVGFRVVINL